MFHADIVDPQKVLYSGDVVEITLPGIDGEFGVLGEHMDMVTPLTVGEIEVKTKDGHLSFAIGKGVFSMEDNKAMVLVQDALSADEISEERANDAKKKAEEIIVRGVSGEQLNAARQALRRSLVDLKIVRKRRLRVRQ